jgi:5-methylcytosine-specific restriction endonuclease McrA
MKPKRKPLSKKLRFEVFKRDNFACQYCGRKAPDVLLTVDHIRPVCEGGENDLLNLTTACDSCHGAFEDRLLDWIKEREVAQDEEVSA